MATHSSLLAWRVPWTEEPGGLQSIGHKELDKTEVISTHVGNMMLWAQMNLALGA